MPDNDFHTPIITCLNQRAAALGYPETWDWVLNDPVVGCFAPVLPSVEEEGLIQLNGTLRQTCQDLYWHSAAYWVRREHRLKPLLENLESAQIPVIPLKGAALVETIYRKIGLRSMCDIDILVKEGGFITTAEIFLANGLQPVWQSESRDLLEFKRLPVQFWPGELSFGDQDGLYIDLHRDLVTYHWFTVCYPVDIEKVWNQRIQLAPRENSIWKTMLSPYDMLAHMCLHLGLHGMQIIVNFLDVDLFIRNLPGDWHWGRFFDIANEWQIRSCAYHVFKFIKYLFDTPIPDNIISELNPGKFNCWLVRQLISPKSYLAQKLTLGLRYPTLVKFALIDNMKLKMNTFRNLVFPKRSRLRNNPTQRNLFMHWYHVIQVIIRGD